MKYFASLGVLKYRMNIRIIDLNKIESRSSIASFAENLCNNLPDVIVFYNYKRNLQEILLHPIQKAYVNFYENWTEGRVIIMKGKLEGKVLLEDEEFVNEW